MIQRFLSILSIFGLVLTPALAVAKPNHSPGFELPAHAREVATNVYSLGIGYDVEIDAFVEGYAIVHKKGNAKGGNGSKGQGPKGTKCYGVMASGAKWKTLEPWVVNPANNDGMSDSFVLNTLSQGLQKWENAAGSEIFGNGAITNATLEADETSTDGMNEIYFGDLGSGGTIGITIVWGIFSGPTFNRQLVEWDQIYNTQFAWSEDAALEPDKMDFDNIATHELGHSAGLADIYTSSCSDATMYGYATEGEIKKRDLDASDVTGINQLY